MSRKIEITGRFRSDEDEACRLAGDSEVEAAERTSPKLPRKPDPFGDVKLPPRKTPKKPNPYGDVE